MLLNSEKYPALRSLNVGPAIKSWLENVATAKVGEKRLRGNTAVKLFSESGSFEKDTVIECPLVGIAVELGGAVVAVALVPEVAVCCRVEVTGVEDASVAVGVGGTYQNTNGIFCRSCGEQFVQAVAQKRSVLMQPVPLLY